VVTRWPHGQEGGVGLARIEPLDGVNPSAGTSQGRLPRSRGDVGVAVDIASAGATEPLDGIEERRSVDPLQLLPGGLPGGGIDKALFHAGPLQTDFHGLEAGGPFGVAKARLVPEIGLVGLEEHDHDAGPYRR
jgi:hypothetical protein